QPEIDRCMARHRRGEQARDRERRLWIRKTGHEADLERTQHEASLAWLDVTFAPKADPDQARPIADEVEAAAKLECPVEDRCGEKQGMHAEESAEAPNERAKPDAPDAGERLAARPDHRLSHKQHGVRSGCDSGHKPQRGDSGQYGDVVHRASMMEPRSAVNLRRKPFRGRTGFCYRPSPDKGAVSWPENSRAAAPAARCAIASRRNPCSCIAVIAATVSGRPAAPSC